MVYDPNSTHYWLLENIDYGDSVSGLMSNGTEYNLEDSGALLGASEKT